MHCTLLISDLLPPSAARGEPDQDLRFPLLETVFARGDVGFEQALDRDAWLCRAFGVARQHDWPVAPLTASADGIDPQHYYWLRADPVELRMERSRLVMARPADDLDATEARDLIAALNGHFARDGLTFLAPVPGRWYLRANHAPGIATTPLARALHRDIEAHLPQGEAALDWHRVINEAQMVLHAHAVNAARETRGAAIANSVWLWGGGSAPARVHSAFQAVWSGDILARSLAAAAGISLHAPPEGGEAWLAAAAAGENHLLVFDPPPGAPGANDAASWSEQLASFERAWIAPLLSALRARKIRRMALVTNRNGNLLEATLVRPQLLRFWRRARPLASYTGA